jgi:hypothetical protein
MTRAPVICFGQQPCGFFPRRFLVAKIQTARRLHAEIGGEIVFFCHDSDHDPRETRTTLRERKSGVPVLLNFAFANKLQRKHSPLYLKRVSRDWQSKTALQLRHFVEPRWVEAFQATDAADVAGFCLQMYRHLGLLDGVRVVRSSDPAFRRAACAVSDFYADVPYGGEIVRGRHVAGALQLHEGGDTFVTLPATPFTKEQISPARDSRLPWMQSVLRCTHYIAGASEQDYLRKDEYPEITFVNRNMIERPDEAYTEYLS